ncbi:MAG: ABC transporter permease, partial [Pyrinomonadaceae bacterium]|nr:ABC transporter permease [Pyrinomonadaceae bacterium]
SFFIFNQGRWTSVAVTNDDNLPDEESRVISQNVAGPDYFTAMGIPLVLGRGFGPQDTDKSQKVAVISEAMAQRFFPNSSPLGRRFGVNGPESRNENEIIGVVKDVKYQSLTEELRLMAYYPHAQRPQPLDNFVVRISGAPRAVVPQVRQTIKQINRNLPIDRVVSLSEHIGESLVQQKLIARLASFFGLLALLLACVGLYGVLSYAVARRTNESGIRMALGAQSRNVLVLILREAVLLVVVGLILGLPAVFATTRFASTLLFGLSPTDPLSLSVAALLLLVVASIAGYIPARRATKVNPLVALRYE